MGWSFFNDVFRCTERDVPCCAMCAFGTLRIKNVIASVAWQSPGRAPCHKPHARYCIMGPNGILCTRWEKEYASVRQTFVACDDCLVKNEAYDAEEKAHTSKRVSVIAPDNVISKEQCATGGRPLVHPDNGISAKDLKSLYSIYYRYFIKSTIKPYILQ